MQPTKQERQACVEQRIVPRHELRTLLEHTRQHAPAWYLSLLTYARAGLGLAEGVALDIENVIAPLAS